MIPVCCAITGAGLALATVTIDKHTTWFARLTYNEGVATALLASLLGAAVSFTRQ
jgi:hypothetical protein